MLLDQSDLTIGQLPLDLRAAYSENEKKGYPRTHLSFLPAHLAP